MVQHLPWTRQASIYEVNVRQFTPEGTLQAFAAHLPRLAAMGVGVLWFMPIQPIGLLNRKGTLGSYYAIRDYTAVNPEFGTLADFRAVVAQAHALGLKVILDWVANHTAWDHPWASSHPQRYKLDAQGQVYSVTFNAGTPQVEYWTDVIGLDYLRPGADQDLWPAMTAAMAFWLREADIDGFRCDVASLVPTPFWNQARAQLDAVKPVFMLAESDAVDLHEQAFDASYDWRLYDTLKALAQGGPATALQAWWTQRQAQYPADAYRIAFTSNHDINSWHGTDTGTFGPAFEAMAVLAATLPGMPLVYGGQEAVLDRQIAFFERDPITWRGEPLSAFYTRLLQAKKTHPALAHGETGGTLAWLPVEDAERSLAFTRVAGERRVTVRVNLGGDARTVAGHHLPAWGWALDLG